MIYPIQLTRFKKRSLMVQEIKKAIDWHGRALGPFILHCAKLQRRHCQYHSMQSLREWVSTEIAWAHFRVGVTRAKAFSSEQRKSRWHI